MIDVITKLREIAARSPEEIGRAIAAAEAMSGRPVTEEMSEKQKKFFGGGKKDDKEDTDDKDGEKKTASKGKKPDFLDMDKDGDKKEPMSKAIKDKEDKKVDEDISITLTGSDAVLAEILKLAGQIGAKTTKGADSGIGGGDMGGSLAPPPVPAIMPPKPMGMPSSGPIPSLSSMLGDKPDMDDMGGMDEPNMDGPGGMDDMGGSDDMDMELDMGDDMDDESMDGPMMDSAFDASTTPSPTTMGIGAAIPSGNDLSKPKMTAPRVSSGDNPFRRSVSFD